MCTSSCGTRDAIYLEASANFLLRFAILWVFLSQPQVKVLCSRADSVVDAMKSARFANKPSRCCSLNAAVWTQVSERALLSDFPVSCLGGPGEVSCVRLYSSIISCARPRTRKLRCVLRRKLLKNRRPHRRPENPVMGTTTVCTCLNGADVLYSIAAKMADPNTVGWLDTYRCTSCTFGCWLPHLISRKDYTNSSFERLYSQS